MIDPFAVELTRTSDLTRAGLMSRQIERLIDGGTLVRVRRGIFAPNAAWSELRAEGRMVVAARAWQMSAGVEPVFSHLTAAAIHGLPFFRTGPTAVHTVIPEPRKGAAPGVVRHRGSIDTGLIQVHGLVVTDVARTMADTARSFAAETSLPVADAALRAVSVDHDDPRVLLLRQRAWETAALFPRGSARSQRVIEFADPRAQLPGESVSRLYLVRLGFAVPRLQVVIEGPNGRRFFVDFGLADVRAFGEFDGDAKYTDARYLGGRSAEQAVLDEKWREDWIRGTSQWRFGRWGSAHLGSHVVLGRRLASFGIVPPVRRRAGSAWEVRPV